MDVGLILIRVELPSASVADGDEMELVLEALAEAAASVDLSGVRVTSCKVLPPRQPDRPAPLLVGCEGSGQPPVAGLCRTCGESVVVNLSGLVVSHDREDVLAMLDRGDFD